MKNLNPIVALVLVFSLCMGPNLFAVQADHVVRTDELRAALVEESSRRASDIQAVQDLLSHDVVRSHIGGLVDLDRIEMKISTLDDETLAQLAADSRFVNDQVQAGISNIAWVAIIVVAISVVIVVS